MNHLARLLTIGHSTLAADAFVAMLSAYRIELLADVRRFPASRRHPQFNREALAEMLASHGIAYHHFPELGGRREPRPGSSNTAWREAGFRGYADYMATADFDHGITRLLEAAKSNGNGNHVRGKSPGAVATVGSLPITSRRRESKSYTSSTLSPPNPIPGLPLRE